MTLTNDYLIIQGLNCLLVVLLGLFLVWHYDFKIGRRVRTQERQYGFFALRDKVIRLVAEDKCSEDDPEWQTLYRHVNEVARAAGVVQVEYGLGMALHCLKTFRPPEETELRRLKEMPENIQKLWIEFFANVVRTCWQGSRVVRLIVRLASWIPRLRAFLLWLRPVETGNFKKWITAQDIAARC